VPTPNSEKLASDDWVTAGRYNDLRDDMLGSILTTEGDIGYMGSAGLERLAPDAGKYLKSQGSGSPVAWATM